MRENTGHLVEFLDGPHSASVKIVAQSTEHIVYDLATDFGVIQGVEFALGCCQSCFVFRERVLAFRKSPRVLYNVRRSFGSLMLTMFGPSLTAFPYFS